MLSLYDRIYAVNAAVTVSNSMGDVTEGLSYQQIEERYGFVDRLLPQDKERRERRRDWGPDEVRPAHHRPAGMTEDGIERHRLMCTAIIGTRWLHCDYYGGTMAEAIRKFRSNPPRE